MQYTVLRAFKCKLTKARYGQGSTFETADPKRAAFLMDKGFLKKQKIKEPDPEPKAAEEELVETEPVNGFRNYDLKKNWPKHVGGGYWETPDGERYKGKETALEAMGGE